MDFFDVHVVHELDEVHEDGEGVSGDFSVKLREFPIERRTLLNILLWLGLNHFCCWFLLRNLLLGNLLRGLLGSFLWNLLSDLLFNFGSWLRLLFLDLVLLCWFGRLDWFCCLDWLVCFD